MTVYYAEIERTDVLVVRFELPDGEEPTDEDVMDAAAYVDNHVDTIVGPELVVLIEKEESQ